MAKYRIECIEPATNWFTHIDHLTFAKAKSFMAITMEDDAEKLRDQNPALADRIEAVADDVDEWADFADAAEILVEGYGYRIVKEVK